MAGQYLIKHLLLREFQILCNANLTEDVAKKIISQGTALSNNIKKKVIIKWNGDFNNSNENELRSINAYYAHNVLGKRKYLSLRKANKQAKFDNTRITNFVSCKTLANRINDVDIGELNDISGFSTSHEKVCGKDHNPASYILDLAKFYLEVDNSREDRLKTLDSFSKKDPSSFLFATAIGGDAAPGTGMAILVSFLDVGERLPSSKEQFLLFGDDSEESSNVVYNF